MNNEHVNILYSKLFQEGKRYNLDIQYTRKTDEVIHVQIVHKSPRPVSELQVMEKVHILILHLRKSVYMGKVLEYFLALLA